jgi:hypothetical protein
MKEAEKISTLLNTGLIRVRFIFPFHHELKVTMNMIGNHYDMNYPKQYFVGI